MFCEKTISPKQINFTEMDSPRKELFISVKFMIKYSLTKKFETNSFFKFFYSVDILEPIDLSKKYRSFSKSNFPFYLLVWNLDRRKTINIEIEIREFDDACWTINWQR